MKGITGIIYGKKKKKIKKIKLTEKDIWGK